MTGRNAERLGVADRLVAKRTSVLAGVAGPFDFIVSNPPYIPSGDIAGLSREVREHDPVAALDGGEDGLAVYRAILDQAPMHLKPGGLVYLETGHDQHAALRGLAAARGFGFVSASRDLAGLERILVLRRA